MLRDITRIFYNSEGAASCDVAALFRCFACAEARTEACTEASAETGTETGTGAVPFKIDLKIREDKIISRERRF